MVQLLQNKNIQVYAMKWLGFWLTAMAFNVFVMKENGITYSNSSFIVAPYFLLMAYIGAFVFTSKTKRFKIFALGSTQTTFIIFSIFFISLPLCLEFFFPLKESVREFLVQQKLEYPLFTFNASFSKWAEIIFQQVLIISLVKFLKARGSKDRESIIYFGLIFFLLHIPLFVTLSFSSLFFIIPSIFGGLIFAFLILKFKRGALYSLGFHMVFYLAFGLIFRLS